EDEVEACGLTEGGDHSVLPVLQDRWPEIDLTGFVHAMDVAEGRGAQVTCTGNRVQSVRDVERIRRRRVEFRRGAGGNAVLFAAHHAGFDLEDELAAPKAFEEGDRNVEVLFQWQCAAVEHVAVEEIRSARRSSALRLLDERHDKLVQLVGLA